MTEETDTRAEMLRAFLAEHDEPCPGCGYNLRGLIGERCPECGEGLRIAVSRVVGRPGWHRVGGYGIAIALLVHSLTFLLLIMYGGGVAAFWMMPGVVFSLLCLVAWIRFRHKIAAASAPVRFVIVAAATLLPLWSFALTVLVAGGLEFW